MPQDYQIVEKRRLLRMPLPLLRTILIATFITASYRLVPLPIGDTARAALLAIVIFALGVGPRGKLYLGFLKEISPLIILVALTVLVDIVLGRVGYYSLLIWVQFMSALFVANTVYSLKPDELRRLLLVSAAILMGQLAFLTVMPNQFIELARALGIVDPFVTYGQTLDRIYFAFFNANSAAYTIYFMFLAWFVIGRQVVIARAQYFSIAGLLIFLALLTGGRGVQFLMSGFLIAWVLAFRSTVGAAFVAIGTVGGIFGLPLYNSAVELILLREESNSARLSAINTYLGYIKEAPFFGMSIQELRLRVAIFGEKPSHVFFIEILGMFGIMLGGAFLLYLFYKLIFHPPSLALRLIGFFALSVGIFNNTLLTTWGFFPLIVPILVAASKSARHVTGRRRYLNTRVSMASSD